MVSLRGNFKMCKNWNMSEKTVPILFVGDGFLSLCITSYLPFRPTLLGDFPACCGRRNASPTPLQIEIWRAVRTCHSEPVRTLVWESPSNSRTRNVIHRRGAHLERPAEKFLIFRFLSAKRCHLAGIFAKTHGTIPSGTQRRNDNTPGPSRLVSRHCRPRLGSRPCPAGAQDERPYEVRRKAA